jgi:uncharacterized membrane protein
MMVVHFPAALFPVEFILHLIGNFTSTPELSTTSYYCLMVGVIGGWAAALTGLIDLFLYVLRSPESHSTGWRHATIQAIVVTGFTTLLIAEYKRPDLIAELPSWLIIAKAVLIILLLAGNYLGGELVLNTVAKQFGFPKKVNS